MTALHLAGKYTLGITTSLGKKATKIMITIMMLRLFGTKTSHE
jgi:hypothetical protein